MCSSEYVAGGGGYKQSDRPASSHTSLSFTGSTGYGYMWFTDNANPYHNEYYWLDGTVTITNHETSGNCNLGAAAVCKHRHEC
jgi:hypothetical protein